mmetsp:Transcript_43412/g.122736  ORF Transcript_43412/g.122736 Transcript_43412/m.122736 type:complete len:233 (-) Transcript_43412:94-792(-)
MSIFSMCCGGGGGEIDEVEEDIEEPDIATADPTVTLHIYDVGQAKNVRRANKVLRRLGTGAFHAAVEVYGAEYSFGGCARGTGVFACRPRSCSAHHYREAMDMGPTPKSAAETAAILAELSQRWQGAEYDLLRHNCCHFSRELLQRLEVKEMPSWVVNLAGAGATVSDGISKARDKKHAMAIVLAAKAEHVDEKYRVKAKFDYVVSREKDALRQCTASCGSCFDAPRQRSPT